MFCALLTVNFILIVLRAGQLSTNNGLTQMTNAGSGHMSRMEANVKRHYISIPKACGVTFYKLLGEITKLVFVVCNSTAPFVKE